MNVRFTTASSIALPSNLVAASAHLNDEAVWMLDENEIDHRDPALLQTLTAVGSEAAAILPALPRLTPRRPWGELRIETDDIEVRDTSWQYTEFGFLIRIPRIFTPKLQAQVEAIGTEQMRWFDPPAHYAAPIP